MKTLRRCPDGSIPTAKKRSLYLGVARTVAIISISLNHAVNRTYKNYEGQQLEFLTIPLIDTVLKSIITVFSKLGVPLFLMFSRAADEQTDGRTGRREAVLPP